MRMIAQFFSKISSKCTSACKNSQPSVASSDRGYWPGRFDFLLSSIGYVLGLGNIWKFPILCYLNGGSAFLIPYFIMVIFAGLPIIFMEMAFGQYTNMGPVHGWKACPIMTGIGWAMCFMCTSISVYYNVVIGWSFYYVFASLTSKLPWSDCHNAWNDQRCLEDWKHAKSLPLGQQPCSDSLSVNCTLYETPTEQYFQRVVLGYVSHSGVLRKMTDPIGKLQWHTSLCLLLSWIVTFLCLMRSVKNSGKLTYITILVPFTALIALVIRGITLPGASIGLVAFLTPDISLLAKSSVWTSATAQAFFSLSAGFGGITTLASYNTLNNNCHRDALIVTIVDCATSLLCSVAVFSILGYMSHRTGQSVSSVVKSDTGLAFIVFTEAAVSMPAGPVWSFIFFVMLGTFGIASQYHSLETLITAFLDQWPRLRTFKLEIGTKAVVCFIMFLLGLPMCCQGGIYIFEIFRHYSASYNLYVIALGEIIGISCFYGLDNFLNDINTMLGFKPGYYWIACWTVICPALLGVIFVFDLVTHKRPEVPGNALMSDWGEAFGWVLMLSSVFIIVTFAVLWRPSATARLRSDLLENRMLRDIAAANRHQRVSFTRHSPVATDE